MCSCTPCQTYDCHSPDGSQEDTTDAIVQVHAPPQVHYREDGTLTRLKSDKEGVDGLEANHEIESQRVQGSEHQDEEGVHADPQGADPKRGAIIDPQDDPQDVGPKRGEIIDPQDDGPAREVQVDPQLLPAPSLNTANLPAEVNEHEMDEQPNLAHDPETQIQVPVPEIPSNWQAPTVSYIKRELGKSMDLLPMEYTIWRPSNPGLPRSALEPKFDEFGVLLGVESGNEDQSHPQRSQQGDLEESIDEDDSKMPALVRDPRNQNQFAVLADNSGKETSHADTSPCTNTNTGVGKDARAYAIVAISSLGSADVQDQPG